MENKILVLYIGVQGIRSEDIGDFTHKVAKKIVPTTFMGEIIVVPTHSPDTRIECINTKYISNDEIIHKHRELMEEINFELEYQLGLLKEENKKIKEKSKANNENGEKKSGN